MRTSEHGIKFILGIVRKRSVYLVFCYKFFLKAAVNIVAFFLLGIFCDNRDQAQKVIGQIAVISRDQKLSYRVLG